MPATKKLTASRAPRLACEGAGPALPKDAVVTVIFAECPPRVARENGVSIAVRGCAVRRRSAGESGSVLPSLATGYARLRPGSLGAKTVADHPAARHWRLFDRRLSPDMFALARQVRLQQIRPRTAPRASPALKRPATK